MLHILPREGACVDNISTVPSGDGCAIQPALGDAREIAQAYRALLSGSTPSFDAVEAKPGGVKSVVIVVDR